jgi:hypothetical protein
MSSQKKVNLGSFKEIEIAPNYKINPQGLVYSTRSKRLLNSYVSNQGYLKITLYINKKKYTKSIHRLLGLAYIPNPNDYSMVDHIDMNKLNNNLENLRWITCSGNNRNRIITTKKSGLPVGVYKAYKKYAAQIWINKKRNYLGSASTPEEAGELYQKAYNEIMNEFYPE